MFRQLFYIQGLPDLKEDTTITITIPANGGQTIPVELEFPADLLVDPNQVGRTSEAREIEEARLPLNPTPTPSTRTTLSARERNLGFQTTTTGGNPPISSPQALMLGSGSPELLAQSASSFATVSADNSISPLRRDPSLGTEQQFLPSIPSSSGRSGSVVPRNQTLATRDTTVSSGLPFMIPAAGGSITPTFQLTAPAQSLQSGTFTRPVSASMPAGPLTGQQLAEEFVTTPPSSTNTPVASPTTATMLPSPGTTPSKTTARSTSQSVASTPSRLSRVSPSKVSAVSASRVKRLTPAKTTPGMSMFTAPPSLSVSGTPTTISSVLTSLSMSGMTQMQPVSTEEEIADREQYTTEAVDEEQMSGDNGSEEKGLEGKEEVPQPVITRVTESTYGIPASGRELFAQEAHKMLQQKGLEMDSDLEEESIAESWAGLTPEERSEWDLDAEELQSDATQKVHREPRNEKAISAAKTINEEKMISDEKAINEEKAKLKPSCNMAVLLMRYATPTATPQ